jgi:hypothetical protein
MWTRGIARILRALQLLSHNIGMTRRLLAAVTIIVIIALAVTLLWRVYVHHVNAEPYGHDDEPVAVSLPSRAA